MPRLTVMPMIGDIRSDDRLGSLRGCHAISDRKVTGTFFDHKQFDATLAKAIRELLLADRVSALDGRTTFIVKIDRD